jgi:hypothetical protein
LINFEDLTLEEIEELELLIGKGIDAAFESKQPKGRALRAFVFIAKKRENPNFKFEDTAKITQAEATKFLSGDDPKDK